MIRGFSDGEPKEVARIRQLLDEALGAGKKPLSCNEVANTIFPISLWNPRASRQKLYARYLRIMPRVLRYPGNRYGVYFLCVSSRLEEMPQTTSALTNWSTSSRQGTGATIAELPGRRQSLTHARTILTNGGVVSHVFNMLHSPRKAPTG